jgi:pyrimidine deaminase RibD-like protein
VLSYGTNVPRKGPETPPFRESIHAEVTAMRGVKKIEGSTLYVVRLDSRNKMALSMPCEYCVEHMISCGVDRVVFSVSETEAKSYYLNSIRWEDS